MRFKLKDMCPILASITANGDMSRLPAMLALLRHLDMKDDETFLLLDGAGRLL